jgi:hypothetical protein
MERILPRLLEKQKMPEWANDEKLEQLIKLCKIHLGVKDDDARQTASPEAASGHQSDDLNKGRLFVCT